MKIIKKLTAFILAIIMAIGITPSFGLVEAYAREGDELRFETSTETLDGYNMTFSFRAHTVTNTTTDVLTGYKIYYRNLTANEAYTEDRIIEEATTATGIISISAMRVLAPGSLYAFSVRPVVRRTITNGNNETITTIVTLGEISAFSALTNIRVEAVGEGNTMTVSWDYPSLPGNTAFFTSYNIYYANIDGNTRQPLQWSTNQISASVNDIKFVDGKATYSFSSVDFQVGRIYAVRIEPTYNGIERSNLAMEIQMGGYGTYNFRSDLGVHYLTDKAYIRPNITLETNSLTNITINWDSLANRPLSNYIARIIVYEVTTSEGGNEEKRAVAIIDNPTQTNTSPPKPASGKANYYIEVYYSDIQYMGANGVVDPYNVTVVSIIAVYDPGAKEFSPYRPDILEISDNKAKPFTLDVTWKAFYRDPMDEVETENSDTVAGVKKFLDKDITYEVAITDDPVNFDNMGTEQSYIVEGKNLTPEYVDGYPYYNYDFSMYYTRTTEGRLEQKAFDQNKIYYVRIRAVRNATSEVSKDAFGSHYIMPIDRIPVEPSMIAKPPLRIKTIDGIEVVDETSITAEWDEEWLELFNPDDGNWYSKVAISSDGSILYGDQATEDLENIMVTKRSITNGYINKNLSKENILRALGLDPNNEEDLKYSVFRLVDIKGASYKMHVAEYNILTEFGYDDYYNEIIETDTTYQWQDITPESTGNITREYKVVNAHNETASPLKPGTPYVVFVRPYFPSDEGDKLAYYPSYVTATTLKDRHDLEIEPTVPILEPVSVTDISVTVRWKYTKELVYELRIDEMFKNYPDGGRAITSEEVLEKGILLNDETTGELYMQLTIDRLYPDTMYYIWIRSTANNASGAKTSDWSNAIEMRTLDIAAPDAPRGLGLVSKYSINIYNQENGTNLSPSTLEYLVVEWLRINADIYNTAGEEGGQAGAPAAEGAKAEYLANPLVNESYIVKFNELIANRLYYIRAKTRLVIVKEADGSASRSYSYIVQISLDPNFTDVVEIEVPVVGDITAGKYKDSEWVSVALITEKTDTEYDGDKNPDLYPLPDKDFEIIYDNATNTLTYRFRSNEKDKDGNHDNQVDERFISRLISNRVFEYNLDLSTYGTKTPAIRVVEFPYSIIKAFNERKISLTVKASNYTVTFPHESLLTGGVKAMGNLDKNAKMKITITQNPSDIVVTQDVNYVSAPHKLSVSLTTTSKVYNYQYFAKPLSMNMAVSGQYVEGATNIGAYVQDGNTAGWQRLSSSFDTVTKSVNFASQRAANYSTIGLVTPWAEEGNTLESMYSVNSKLNVTDIGTYSESQNIVKGQLNQLMAAALKGSTSVVMNTNLTAEDKNSLEKAGLLFTGNGNDIVTREEGIAKLVKLYEIKTRYPVTGYPGINETGYADIAQASAGYQKALLKAVELGFYRTNSANPKGSLTFGDTMHMLDIILSY